jgi:flagellar basal-body rod protein FlgB
MFIDRLLNQGSSPLLEQWLRFTDARAQLLGEDVVNASTPGYVQKDLSLDGFEAKLSEKLQKSQEASPGSTDFNDIDLDGSKSAGGLLFHDRNNRSMEQLMTDQAKNALMHNLAVELLRHQYSILTMALTEKPA